MDFVFFVLVTIRITRLKETNADSGFETGNKQSPLFCRPIHPDPLVSTATSWLSTLTSLPPTVDTGTVAQWDCCNVVVVPLNSQQRMTKGFKTSFSSLLDSSKTRNQSPDSQSGLWGRIEEKTWGGNSELVFQNLVMWNITWVQIQEDSQPLKSLVVPAQLVYVLMVFTPLFVFTLKNTIMQKTSTAEAPECNV